MVSLLKEYFGYRSESKDVTTAIMMAYKKSKRHCNFFDDGETRFNFLNNSLTGSKI